MVSSSRATARGGAAAGGGVAIRMLPVLGAYARAQALAHLSFTLANLLEAGVPIGRAWAVAGLIAR